MNAHQHPMDVLTEDIRMRTLQAQEWEKTTDPHATNVPRAELLRRQIADDEAAIEILRLTKQEEAKQWNSPPSPSLRRGEFADANSEAKHE